VLEVEEAAAALGLAEAAESAGLRSVLAHRLAPITPDGLRVPPVELP
jgi:hypothetical protein